MEPTPAVWRSSPKFQDRVWRHVALFALTIVTTTYVGANHYASFLTDFSFNGALPKPLSTLFVGGGPSGTSTASYAGTIANTPPQMV